MLKKANLKLASAIVLGLMMAVPFSASAAEVTVETGAGYVYGETKDLSGNDVTYTAKDNTAINNKIIGADGGSNLEFKNAGTVKLEDAWINNAFLAGQGGTLKVSDVDSIITTNDQLRRYAVFMAYNGKIDIDLTENLDLQNVYTGLWAQRDSDYDGGIDLDAQNVHLKNNVAIIAANYTDQNNDSKSVAINVKADNVVIERIKDNNFVDAPAYNTKYDNNYAIVSTSEKYNTGSANEQTQEYAGKTSVNIEAANIEIYADLNDGYGAILAANGKDAGDAKVNLNAETIHLEGDIMADTNAAVAVAATQKADIIADVTAKENSAISLNLGTNGSFTGTATMSDTNTNSSTIDLNLGTGSTWNVTGDSEVSTVSGTGSIAVDSLETEVTVAKNDSTGLTLVGTSEVTNSFDSNDIAGGMQDLVDVLAITDGNKNITVTAYEGDVIGETTLKTDENGDVIESSIKTETNSKTAGIGELANVAFMAWRAENDEMHQRMGELRSSTGDAGIWARMKRGESESGDLDITNQYSTYQLGYDEKVGDSNWYIGGAISRTEGKSSFANGSGENQSTGFTVYGTYVGDDGQYLDLSAKYARLDNEFDVFGRDGVETTGDYRNNGYAISAEYGKRIAAANNFWVEPQVQLTYGHLSSANYTTSRGVEAAQDAMNSVVGRVGFAAGKEIGAGDVYVKASYLYDFDGDTSVTMSKAEQSETYEQDLGGGWFEFGIGTNINLSETSHLYFDVEKAVGGDIDTPWQWNAGVRFDF